MNKATRNHEKKILDLVAKHMALGTKLEEIGRRVWICYGYLNEVKGGKLIVKMHAGETVLATEDHRTVVA
jgi:hypothetical protein